MIYYDYYSKVTIFESAPLNVFFNQLYTSLINVLGETKVRDNLLIDGKVALLLQEQPVPPKYNKIELSTNDLEIFKYLKTNAKILPIKDYTITDGRLVVTTNINFVVYINYVESTMTTYNHMGLVKVRHQSEII
ncbi:MAG: hypothetical protein ACK4ON_13235 [Bacteroidia bacterium]